MCFDDVLNSRATAENCREHRITRWRVGSGVARVTGISPRVRIVSMQSRKLHGDSTLSIFSNRFIAGGTIS